MIAELNHVGIKTADMEASIGFYQNVLGGTIVRDAKSRDGLSRFVYIQLGQGIVELITSNDPADQGYVHVAFLLDGAVLDQSYEKLSQMGIEFPVKPKTAGSGDGRLAFFHDPCGVLVEMIERERRPRADLPKNEKVLSFGHILIGAGSQLEACQKFYGSAMEMDEVGGGRYSKDQDAMVFTAEEGGILRVAMKTTNTEALRAQLRAGGIATRDAEGGFIAVAPSGEQIYLYQE